MSKELLFSVTRKDLKIDYFSGTGPGGQNRNKNQNCVRIRHLTSGAIVTGQSHKSRKANLKEALGNLVADPEFRLWHNRVVHEVLEGETLEQRVEKLMAPRNLKVEIKKNERWECDNQIH